MKETTTKSSKSSPPSRRDLRSIVLNVIIVALTVVVGYLAYSLVVRHVVSPPVETGKPGETSKQGVATGSVIQMDVLNGCGVSKAASIVTAFLRQRGYDVVEMRNYKTFDVPESLVIDRTGNLETARKVAYALGVKEQNIVQQINQDYYVDVSIVIGKDYQSLKASQ